MDLQREKRYWLLFQGLLLFKYLWNFHKLEFYNPIKMALYMGFTRVISPLKKSELIWAPTHKWWFWTHLQLPKNRHPVFWRSPDDNVEGVVVCCPCEEDQKVPWWFGRFFSWEALANPRSTWKSIILPRSLTYKHSPIGRRSFPLGKGTFQRLS